MRLLLAITSLFLLSTFMGPELQAQEFPKLDKSPLDAAYYPSRAAFRAFEKTDEARKANEPVIRVLYSRPQQNGREIFGNLVKYGEPWRAGANESTEITFFQDVEIGGSTVAAGRYTLYVTPSEEEWEVVVNTSLDGWGHYAYDPEMNVASIKVPVAATEEPVEAFSILFEKADDGAHMIMAWGDTMARVPIQF